MNTRAPPRALPRASPRRENSISKGGSLLPALGLVLSDISRFGYQLSTFPLSTFTLLMILLLSTIPKSFCLVLHIPFSCKWRMLQAGVPDIPGRYKKLSSDYRFPHCFHFPTSHFALFGSRKSNSPTARLHRARSRRSLIPLGLLPRGVVFQTPVISFEFPMYFLWASCVFPMAPLC